MKDGAEVEITPEVAKQFLDATWGRNRPISPTYVEILAGRMLRKEFGLTQIGFLKPDLKKFCDGHHRMEAVIKSGVSIPCSVKGMTMEDLINLDGTRERKLRVRIRMFRPGVTNPSAFAAAARVAAGLIAGQRVRLDGLSEYEAWAGFLEPGLSRVVNFLNEAKTIYRYSGISGALAFAHHRSPDETMKFARQLRDGIGVEEDSPAFVFRRFFERRPPTGGNAGINMIAEKTLTALYAHETSTVMTRLNVNTKAIRYYMEGYDKGSVTKLLRRMLPFREIG